MQTEVFVVGVGETDIVLCVVEAVVGRRQGEVALAPDRFLRIGLDGTIGVARIVRDIVHRKIQLVTPYNAVYDCRCIIVTVHASVIVTCGVFHNIAIDILVVTISDIHTAAISYRCVAKNQAVGEVGIIFTIDTAAIGCPIMADFRMVHLGRIYIDATAIQILDILISVISNGTIAYESIGNV